MRNDNLKYAKDVNDEVTYAETHSGYKAPDEVRTQHAILAALVGIGELLDP